MHSTNSLIYLFSRNILILKLHVYKFFLVIAKNLSARKIAASGTVNQNGNHPYKTVLDCVEKLSFTVAKKFLVTIKKSKIKR